MLKLKKMFVYGSIASAVLLASGLFSHESHAASAKATCQLTNISLVKADFGANLVEDTWHTVLSNTIHTSNEKCLFVDVSFECGLLTRTLVRSKGGDKDTSNAIASIEVRVRMDNDDANLALPGEVTFSRREQELSATFQGLLEDESGNVCMYADPETGVITIDEECLLPEEIELLLSTMTANSFNFVTNPLSPGDHTIDIQVRINTSESYEEGDAEAVATIGKGSFTVDEVRFIKDENIEM